MAGLICPQAGMQPARVRKRRMPAGDSKRGCFFSWGAASTPPGLLALQRSRRRGGCGSAPCKPSLHCTMSSSPAGASAAPPHKDM